MQNIAFGFFFCQKVSDKPPCRRLNLYPTTLPWHTTHMSDKLSKHYDHLYKSHHTGFAGTNPLPFVRRVPELITEGAVLDIGGGPGRNALFLARHGFAVTVVDISTVGLQRATADAAADNLPIIAIIGDITKLGLKDDYDVIIMTYVLHLIDTTAATNLITDIQAHTKPNGLVLITTFTKEGDFYRNDPTASTFYPDSNELRTMFPAEDWQLLEYTEKETAALKRREDGTPLLNTTAFLLARKI